MAEIAPDPNDYPGALPHMLKPGSLVFAPPRHLVDLRDWSQWWRFEFGANWRQPEWPGTLDKAGSTTIRRYRSLDDAEAYAAWAGKDLPTEAEWEYAARGGLDGAEFAWGDELTPGGRHMANTWQGAFPHENLAADGYARTSPAGVFPANGYGLLDMIGNVWEWTADWYSARHAADAPKACCIPENPRGGCEADSYGQCSSPARIPRKVVKGGSHLCAPNTAAATVPPPATRSRLKSGMSHVGFRCVSRTWPDVMQSHR